MSQLSQYILSVTGAAMLTAVLGSLAGQGSMGTLVKLLAGVFLALTILAPVVTLELPDPAGWLSQWKADGAVISDAGVAMAEDVAADIITNRVEAYIQDKAAQYQASITAAVTLDQENVPVSVVMTGEISPYARNRLTEILEQDLGIGKEAQRWQSNVPAG